MKQTQYELIVNTSTHKVVRIDLYKLETIGSCISYVSNICINSYDYSNRFITLRRNRNDL